MAFLFFFFFSFFFSFFFLSFFPLFYLFSSSSLLLSPLFISSFFIFSPLFLFLVPPPLSSSFTSSPLTSSPLLFYSQYTSWLFVFYLNCCCCWCTGVCEREYVTVRLFVCLSVCVCECLAAGFSLLYIAVVHGYFLLFSPEHATLHHRHHRHLSTFFIITTITTHPV